MLLQMRKKRKRLKRPGDEWRPIAGVAAVRGSLHPAELAPAHFTRKARWLAVALAACVLGLSPRWLIAKEKKIPRMVTGVVLDANDNGIVGATVELTDIETGKKVAMFTQEGGRYQFSDIKPTHDYKVQASYKGSSSEIRKASVFDTRNKIVLNLKIPPPKP